MQKNIKFFFLFFLIFEILANCSYSNEYWSELSRLIDNKSSVIVADECGKIVFGKNVSQKMIPASIIKLFTSLSAFYYLGSNYRFKTDFYFNKKTCDLTIYGYGDPLFISEVIDNIAKEISVKTEKINNIVIDDSYFNYPIIISGQTKNTIQPYDAPAGAVCANFNTVWFKTDNNGIFISSEKQTPFLDFVKKKVELSGIDCGRIPLSFNESRVYAGHLLRFFLSKKYNVSVKGCVVLYNRKQDRGDLLYTYLSEFSIKEVVSSLLYYSNNFIANQLFLTSGAKYLRHPATLIKAQKAAENYYKNIIKIDKIKIYEGSGLSTKNRINALGFLKILKEFYPYKELMKYNNGEYFKTGTLKNVHTRAGYIKDRKGKYYMYVVFVNSFNKNTDLIMKVVKRKVLDLSINDQVSALSR